MRTDARTNLKLKMENFDRRFLPLPIRYPRGSCFLCGCTQKNPCPGGCWWVAEDLCNVCLDAIANIVHAPTPGRTRAAVRRAKNANVLVAALEHARGDWRRVLIRRRLEDLKDRKS